MGRLYDVATVHCGPEQPKIQIGALGHSLVRSLVRSHRSLVCLLRTARFARALRCAHSFAPEVVGRWNVFVQFSRCPELLWGRQAVGGRKRRREKRVLLKSVVVADTPEIRLNEKVSEDETNDLGKRDGEREKNEQGFLDHQIHLNPIADTINTKKTAREV